MRLWSLHPARLDPAGLVAAWREALLARAVLRGTTRGYCNHPQLDRFKAHANPVAAINTYLAGLYDEAVARGYRFNGRKFAGPRTRTRIAVTRGQLAFERKHLEAKLRARNPTWLAIARMRGVPSQHPLFRARAGRIAAWERSVPTAPRARDLPR